MQSVLSFGAGVQSVTILQLILDREIERPSIVVFADTQNEPQSVYDVVAQSATKCDAIGLPFYTVTRGDLGAWEVNNSIHVPVYTKEIATGKLGQLFRTCTDRFKLEAIKDKCRLLGMGHNKEVAEMWIGFSVDEINRVGSGANLPKWITRRFPLLDLNMRRSDCESYLDKRGVVAGKSACTFCPYRTNEGWVLFRKRDPKGFAHAVAYDEYVRHARPGHLSYVHRQCIPLSSVPIAQPGLFDAEFGGDGCETGLCEVF